MRPEKVASTIHSLQELFHAQRPGEHCQGKYLEMRRQTGGDTKEKIKQVNKGNASALTRKRKYLLICTKGLNLRIELGSEF